MSISALVEYCANIPRLISEYLSKSSTFAISITHSADVKSRIDKFLILSLLLLIIQKLRIKTLKA